MNCSFGLLTMTKHSSFFYRQMRESGRPLANVSKAYSSQGLEINLTRPCLNKLGADSCFLVRKHRI